MRALAPLESLADFLNLIGGPENYASLSYQDAEDCSETDLATESIQVAQRIRFSR